MKNLLQIASSDGLCNCRIKLYPDKNGEWYPVQKMTSEKKIFNPLGLERSGYSHVQKKVCFDRERYPEEEQGSLVTGELGQTGDEQIRSIRRARAKVYDIIRCNLSFRFFVTLTYSQQKINRTSTRDVVRCFGRWADNRVRRNGLKYVAVIERHKKSDGLHFHMLCNDVLHLVDSGTVKSPNHKKPIKIATADKYKIPECDRKTVYNIADWGYGFTTAIEITGDDNLVKVSAYLQKYLTKDSEKIGGRYYYSGGNLLRPRFTYCNDDFYNCDESYTINVPGNTIKVLQI